MADTTLESVIRGRNALPQTAILSIVRQCAVSLDRTGPSRRTPAPADIVVSDTAEPDGITAEVKDLASERVVDQEFTLGKPNPEFAPYLAPEEILGGEKDARADQFALAVIAYELLCGNRPFSGGNLSLLFYEICANPPTPATQANPKLPAEVEPVFEKALSKYPDARFESSTAFADALRRAVQGHTAPALNGPVAAAIPLAAATAAGAEAASAVATPPAAARPEAVAAPAAVYDLPPARRRPRWDEDGTGRPPTRSALTDVPSGRGSSRKWIIAAVLVAIGIILAGIRWQSGPKHQAPTNMGPTAPAQQPAPAPQQTQPAAASNSPQATAPAQQPSTGRSLQQSPAPAAAHPPPSTPSVQPTPTTPKERMAATAPPVATHRGAAEYSTPQRAGSGSVDLVTSPPGAKITIDHTIICTAPCTLSLPAGRHVLSATLGGYATAERIFHVPEDNSVIIDLAQGAGVLLVNSIPAGATVMIDGKEVGRAPLSVHVTAGQHRVDLFSGSQSRQQVVSIQPDTIQGVTVNMQ